MPLSLHTSYITMFLKSSISYDTFFVSKIQLRKWIIKDRKYIINKTFQILNTKLYFCNLFGAIIFLLIL